MLKRENGLVSIALPDCIMAQYKVKNIYSYNSKTNRFYRFVQLINKNLKEGVTLDYVLPTICNLSLKWIVIVVVNMWSKLNLGRRDVCNQQV